MALCADKIDMRTGQREICSNVVEASALPIVGRMTQHAIMAELPLHVVRISRAVVIGLVTRIAVRRQTIVLPARMALGAG